MGQNGIFLFVINHKIAPWNLCLPLKKIIKIWKEQVKWLLKTMTIPYLMEKHGSYWFFHHLRKLCNQLHGVRHIWLKRPDWHFFGFVNAYWSWTFFKLVVKWVLFHLTVCWWFYDMPLYWKFIMGCRTFVFGPCYRLRKTALPSGTVLRTMVCGSWDGMDQRCRLQEDKILGHMWLRFRRIFGFSTVFDL